MRVFKVEENVNGMKKVKSQLNVSLNSKLKKKEKNSVKALVRKLEIMEKNMCSNKNGSSFKIFLSR